MFRSVQLVWFSMFSSQAKFYHESVLQIYTDGTISACSMKQIIIKIPTFQMKLEHTM